MLEKRKFLRIPHKSPIYCEMEFVSNLCDISVNGCFIETNQDLTSGTVINVEFTLPNTPKIIRAKGEVRWCGNYSSDNRFDQSKGVGIKFIDIDVEDIATISNFVRKNASILRKHDRHEIEFHVNFGPEHENHLDQSAYAMDLGLGGMFLKTDHPVDLDQIIKLEFTLPNQEEAVEATAKVVYVNQSIPDIFSGMIHSGMGIEFVQISDRALEMIDEFLSSVPKGDESEMSID